MLYDLLEPELAAPVERHGAEFLMVRTRVPDALERGRCRETELLTLPPVQIRNRYWPSWTEESYRGMPERTALEEDGSFVADVDGHPNRQAHASKQPQGSVPRVSGILGPQAGMGDGGVLLGLHRPSLTASGPNLARMDGKQRGSTVLSR